MCRLSNTWSAPARIALVNNRLQLSMKTRNCRMVFSRPLFLRFELDNMRVSVILALQREEGLRGDLAKGHADPRSGSPEGAEWAGLCLSEN